MADSRLELLRARLLAWARSDPRVVGAAVTGSAATGAVDRWSDVDLFLGVAEPGLDDVLRDVSDHLYAQHGAVHHFDVTAGAAIYRAFLLDGLLEVDLGLAPAAEFRSHAGAPFRVVFGAPKEPSPAAAFDVDHLAGLVWHHVLHARSSIERSHPWQAEHWISAVRDHVLALAAHRHGQPTAYAKGADALPVSVTEPLQQALVRGLDRDELDRALRHVTAAALQELERHLPGLAHRLEPSLQGAANRDAWPGREA